MRQETEALVRSILPYGFQNYLYRVRWGYTNWPVWLQGWLYKMWGRTITEAEKEIGAVFIHIPKNAGNSICQAIFGRGVGHRAIRTLKLHEPDLVTNLFTFTFVRNPWDRFLSAYKFLKRGGVNTGDKEWAKRHLSRFRNFREFTRAMGNEEFAETVLWEKHFRPQSFWLLDEKGEIRVDYVGRFEKLEKDFNELCSLLGIRRELQHLNRGEHKDFRFYYDKQSIEMVRQLYQKDINLFDYSFGQG